MIKLNYSVMPEVKARCITDVVPGEVLVTWGCRLYTLMNLAWDYVDTVCDLCINMRLTQTKRLVRAIRQTKRDYDRFRQSSVDGRMLAEETERGLDFEEWFSADFDKLFNGLSNDVGKLGLTKEHAQLVIAVQQALTIMDAVSIYARRCDSTLKSRYDFHTADRCLVQSDFLKLYGLVPQFAGDCYNPDLEARRLTANILANRLQTIPVNVDKDGEMVMVKE